jgi:hypothetical protein
MTQAGGLQSRRTASGLRWIVQARRRSAPLPAAKEARRRHFNTMYRTVAHPAQKWYTAFGAERDSQTILYRRRQHTCTGHGQAPCEALP